jgi:hypothetical protein
MEELVVGMILIVGGIILLLFRKQIARYTTLGQNKVWSGYDSARRRYELPRSTGLQQSLSVG